MEEKRSLIVKKGVEREGKEDLRGSSISIINSEMDNIEEEVQDGGSMDEREDTLNNSASQKNSPTLLSFAGMLLGLIFQLFNYTSFSTAASECQLSFYLSCNLTASTSVQTCSQLYHYCLSLNPSDPLCCTFGFDFSICSNSNNVTFR